MSLITRPALGSVKKLGDLYDARNDTFCGISILKEGAPNSAIQTRDSPSCDTKYIDSDKYSEKFEKLDVKAELKLGVLCGTLSLEGSARYLSNEKSSKRAVRITLMHSIGTKVEELSIYNDSLKECVALDALNHEATHVVTGIKWGANLMVTAEYTNEENEDTMQVEGDLKAQLDKIKFAISGNAGIDYTKGGTEKEKQFSLNIYGDVLPEGDLPQNIDEAKELIRKLPNLIQKSNDGKGKPLQYVLLPVDKLKSCFGVQTTGSTMVRELSEDVILGFVHFFDQITDAKQQLNDLYGDVVKHRLCLSESTRRNVQGLKSKADIWESSIRSQLAELLMEVRQGRAEASRLEELRMKYEQDPNSAENILKQINLDDISDKISVYQFLTTTHGVIFVSNTVQTLDALLLKHFGKDLYILFSTAEAKMQNKSLWKENLNLFLRLMQEHNPLKRPDPPPRSLGQQSVFLYVDLDITPRLSPQGTQVLVIQHFKNMECIAPNLYEDHAKDSGLCLVKSDAVVNSGSKPKEVAALEIQCPSSLHGRCETNVQKWACFKCKTDVEYGFNGYFYCRCGSGKADTYSYRCVSQKHGDVFERFNWDESMLLEFIGKAVAGGIEALDLDHLMDENRKVIHELKQLKEWIPAIKQEYFANEVASTSNKCALLMPVTLGLSFWWGLASTAINRADIEKCAKEKILNHVKAYELKKALESRAGVYNTIGNKILKRPEWIEYAIQSAKLCKDVLTHTLTGIRLRKVMKFLAITAPEQGDGKAAFTFSHQGLAELEIKLRESGLRDKSNTSKAVGACFDIDTIVETWITLEQDERQSQIDMIVSCMESQLEELQGLRNEFC